MTRRKVRFTATAQKLAFLRDSQKRTDVKRYVQGYIEHPERAEEVDAIRSASYAALAQEPWD